MSCPSHRWVLAFAFASILLITPAIQANKKAIPPTAKDLIGVWVGFDRTDLDFTRLELFADGTGFLARVAPADLHDRGVHVWRVTVWKNESWDISIQTSPISNAYNVANVSGRIGLASLSLTMGGPDNGGWKEQLLLYPESRIRTSNDETRAAIEAVRKH